MDIFEDKSGDDHSFGSSEEHSQEGSERSFMKLAKKSLGEQLLEDPDSDDEDADKTFKL